MASHVGTLKHMQPHHPLNKPEAPLPRTIGEFTLLARLGSGSFADVYKAEGPAKVTHNAIECAIKILHRQDMQALHRLENEHYALCRLDHPSIPKGYAIGHIPSPHIAMQIVHGRSIRAIRREDKNPFDHARVTMIVTALLEALVHMDGKGVQHRDIKDDNVILGNDERVYLVDFGYCKAQNQPREPQTWGGVGADLYAPPSKLTHPSQTHQTHDVFAVGVLAYFLLSGRYPWFADGDGSDRGTLVELMSSTKPEPLSRLVPTTPHWLETFIIDLLTINDADRPQASEALSSLRACLKIP